MPVQPIRPTPAAPSRPRSTDWGVDLPPVGPRPTPGPGPAPAPGPRPVPQPGPLDPWYSPTPNRFGRLDRRPVWAPTPDQSGIQGGDGNETRLNGRNLRYAISGEYYVSIPYITADLIDRSPQDPLDLWAVGSYTFAVQAARIDLDQNQVNGAVQNLLAELPNAPAKNVALEFLDGNRLKVGGTAKVGPVPVPFSIRVKITATSPDTVNVAPESIKAFGLPVGWLVRLLNLDIPKLMKLPAGGPLTMGAKGSIDADLRKVDLFRGRISGFGIAQGRAAIQLGGAPDADVSPARRANSPNWAEVTAKGEASLDTGVIRDARTVIIDSTPQDPYTLNRWDLEGYARLERGSLVLTEKMLKTRFASAGGDGFIMNDVRLVGPDLVIKGEKEVLGLPIPVRFKIRFGNTAKGELLLTPHDVHVAGLGFGKSQIVDAMKKMPGMRQSGDSLILDLRKAASLEMLPIRSVTAEPGQIVVSP